MKHRIPYKVPDGYFEETKSRLETISFMKERHSTMNWVPYLAVAAAICVALVIGNSSWNKPSVRQQESLNQEIVDYLISSGLTLAQLEDHFD